MSLTSSLLSAADALHAFDRVLEVTQNNVANVATPGFVKQRQVLVSRPFDPDDRGGPLGGVRAADIRSSRDLFAEQAVRRQAVQLGRGQQSVSSLTALESVLDVSGSAGIPNALANLFDSFSAWAQSPNDGVVRQNVIERAVDLATAFNQTANNLANVAQDSERQIQDTVDHINRLTARLQTFNVQVLRGGGADPALDAQIHTTLEELSQYAEITALHQADGSVTVLMNGQTALAVADKQYALGYRLELPADPPPAYPGARPLALISAPDGTDITAASTGGKLGALLDFRNQVLTSYIGDAARDGDLNHMAAQLGGRINSLLASGGGLPLFTIAPGNPTAAAQTLAVNPAITAGQLATAAPGPPPVSNGIPLALSAISNPQIPADHIDGVSYAGFFGGMAARAGRGLSDAKSFTEIHESTLAQAKDLREQLTGISLDEEAVILIQFQRAYEANARFVTAIDRMTQAILNMKQ